MPQKRRSKPDVGTFVVGVFKGKSFVQNHHLLVKYHQLIPRKDKSLTEKVSLRDNLIIHGDGHSEKKTWDDPRTQRWSNEIRDGTRYPDMTGLSDPENVDIRWLAAHYPRKH